MPAETYERSGRVIVENLNIEIYGGKRIAMLGANGSGKSSILELLVGSRCSPFRSPETLHIPDKIGEIIRRPGISVGYMPQQQDSLTLECLEQALSEYKGALVVVSHDRFFIDYIKPDLIWTIKNRSVVQTYVDSSYRREPSTSKDLL